MNSRKRNYQRLSARDRDDLLAVLAGFKADVVVSTTEKSAPAGLSAREIEVLRLVARGKNNSEIADELFISLNTVTRHMTNVFTKTDTANRVEAAVFATRHRIL